MTAFDLRKFSPPPIEFILEDGVTYRVTGDPDLSLLGQMLRIEEGIRRGDKAAVADHVLEGKQVILTLIRQTDPGVESIPLGVTGLLALFALIADGPTVAQAIAEGLTDLARLDEEGTSALERAEQGESGVPLASPSFSSEPSSSLDTNTDGPPATGMGSAGERSAFISATPSSV